MSLRQFWFLTLQWANQNFHTHFHPAKYSFWPKWIFPQFCYDINQRKNIIWIFQILIFWTLPNILYTGYFWTQGNSIVQTAHCKMSVHIICTCWLQICKTLQLFLQSVKTWTLTANRKKCWGLPKTYDFVSNAMERRPLLQFQ